MVVLLECILYILILYVSSRADPLYQFLPFKIITTTGVGCVGDMGYTTQETTAMLFAYTNATLLLKWSKERSDVQTQVSKGKKSN